MPGLNVICAATFLAAIGDIRRLPNSRQLVVYLTSIRRQLQDRVPIAQPALEVDSAKQRRRAVPPKTGGWRLGRIGQ
jgi:hypothetical protein